MSTAISDCRASLLAGRLHVPVELGLAGPAAHIERGERECLSAAFKALGEHLGPAARIIDCGPFAGLAMAPVLGLLERPKAGVIMSSNFDVRHLNRLRDTSKTAEISHVQHDASVAFWPLETVGLGKTLVFISGGGFGLAPPPKAFAMLENAAHALDQGDFVALTLETPRDGAVIDAIYCEFGRQVVNAALANLGRTHAIDPRTFYDSRSHLIRFGAIAKSRAWMKWNGTRCDIEEGAWLDVGAMALHAPDTSCRLHPDFEVHDQWQSQENAVILLLLRKI